MEEKLTRRESLCGRNRGKPRVLLDMEEVYRYLDNGHTVKEATEHFGVCENTLRRHHESHQKHIEAVEKQREQLGLTPPTPIDFNSGSKWQ